MKEAETKSNSVPVLIKGHNTTISNSKVQNSIEKTEKFEKNKLAS